MPLRVGIVGTGIFATDSHLPTIESIPELRPSAAYNRTMDKANVFAQKANINQEHVYEHLDDLAASSQVDIIDALLPVQYNLNVVRTAIKFNKPIIIEKPIAANLSQAREIVELAGATQLPIGILENWAFFNAIPQVQKILPKIGEVFAFSYTATSPWNPDSKYLSTEWRKNPKHIGGYLSDGGVHQLALLTEILGQVESVSAQTKQIRELSGADDILFSTMKLKSGAIGTFTYGSAFGASDKSTSLTIFGTNGSIVYDFSPSLPKPTITYKTGSNAKEASDQTVIEVEEVNALQEEFKNFAAAVKAKDKSLVKVPPAKAFHHLAIVDAALESSSKGGVNIKVELP